MWSPSQDPQVKKRKLEELAQQVRKKSREVRIFQSVNQSFGSDSENDESLKNLPCFGDDFIEDDGIQDYVDTSYTIHVEKGTSVSDALRNRKEEKINGSILLPLLQGIDNPSAKNISTSKSVSSIFRNQAKTTPIPNSDYSDLLSDLNEEDLEFHLEPESNISTSIKNTNLQNSNIFRSYTNNPQPVQVKTPIFPTAPANKSSAPTINNSIPINTTPKVAPKANTSAFPVNIANAVVTKNTSIPITANPKVNTSIPINTTSTSIPVNTTAVLPKINASASTTIIPTPLTAVPKVNTSIPVNTVVPKSSISIPKVNTSLSITPITTTSSIPINTTNASVPFTASSKLNTSIPINTIPTSVPLTTSSKLNTSAVPMNTTTVTVPKSNTSVLISTTVPVTPKSSASIPINTTNTSPPMNTTSTVPATNTSVPFSNQKLNNSLQPNVPAQKPLPSFSAINRISSTRTAFQGTVTTQPKPTNIQNSHPTVPPVKSIIPPNSNLKTGNEVEELTEEQKKTIEANRNRALMLRKQKMLL